MLQNATLTKKLTDESVVNSGGQNRIECFDIKTTDTL